MSDRVRQVETAFDRNIAAIARGLREFPWEDAAAYRCWLAQTYYLVSHTTTLLTLMASKLGPKHPEEHEAVLKHLREETGHDKMALKDLKTLGGDIAQLPELIGTSALYQSQYYWLHEHAPHALSGYALMLEGLSIKEGPAVLERVQKAHGKRASLFLEVHVREDVKHFSEGVKRLAQIEPARCEAALKNLEQSQQRYRAMLHEIAHFASTVVPMKRAA